MLEKTIIFVADLTFPVGDIAESPIPDGTINYPFTNLSEAF